MLCHAMLCCAVQVFTDLSQTLQDAGVLNKDMLNLDQ